MFELNASILSFLSGFNLGVLTFNIVRQVYKWSFFILLTGFLGGIVGNPADMVNVR